MNFLIVGHTHEDIDQIFGVLPSLAVGRHRFHTPDELVLEIHIAMRKVLADRPGVVSDVLLPIVVGPAEAPVLVLIFTNWVDTVVPL